MTPERVPFGCREVTADEKRRLVCEQFNPIAKTCDLADAVLSAGLDEPPRRSKSGNPWPSQVCWR